MTINTKTVYAMLNTNTAILQEIPKKAQQTDFNEKHSKMSTFPGTHIPLNMVLTAAFAWRKSNRWYTV